MGWLIGGFSAGFAPVAIVALSCRLQLHRARRQQRFGGACPDHDKVWLTPAEASAISALDLMYGSRTATRAAAERERAQKEMRGVTE